jgi:hypothetical protein
MKILLRLAVGGGERRSRLEMMLLSDQTGRQPGVTVMALTNGPASPICGPATRLWHRHRDRTLK